MTRLTAITSLVLSLTLAWAAPVPADQSNLGDATRKVESGAKTTGEGIKDTAKGIGNTVSEGAKKTGERFNEASRAAEPEARNAWGDVRDGAKSFGRSVKSFFVRLFNRD
jgi:hypothetical protein